MEIGVPRGLDVKIYHAKIKRHSVDRDEIPFGVENFNPITDTRIYDVEYIDGTIKNLAANVIANNILSQVDE